MWVAAERDGRSGSGPKAAAAAGRLQHKRCLPCPFLRHLLLERSELPGLPAWKIRFFLQILNTLKSLHVKIRLLRIHRLSKTLAKHPTPVLKETDRHRGKRWGRDGVNCSSLAKPFQLQPAITRKGSCEDPLKGNVLTKASNCINWTSCIHTCWAK